MNHFLIKCAAAASLAALTACGPDDVPTIHGRSPHRVEFQQRDMKGIEVGASLPESVKAVDLGLSVRWADMNLGGNTISESGGLFAWGEIAPSGNYGWDSYEFNEYHSDDPRSLYLTRYCFDSYGELQDLEKGGIELDRNDDAAYVMWGKDWRMPTISELEELSSECDWTYESGRKQFKVTGPNGNSISIAFPGVGIGTKVYDEPQGIVDGGIWSSTLSGTASPFAGKLTLVGREENRFEMRVEKETANRWVGCIIRPVHAE